MVKNPLLILFIILVLGSCAERPTFPDTPSIERMDFYFQEIQDISLDSLVINVRFKDGNGDLGLDATDTQFPYQLMDIQTDDVTGDTLRFGDPGAPEDYNCVDYEIFRREIVVNDSLIITADTVYVVRNPNHFNFFLDFLIEEPRGSGSFRVFDPALERNCAPRYHGRYFVLNTARDIRPLEGELQYNLVSGFRLLFRNETIRLRVQIQDRALNKSNIIETNNINILDIIRPAP